MNTNLISIELSPHNGDDDTINQYADEGHDMNDFSDFDSESTTDLEENEGFERSSSIPLQLTVQSNLVQDANELLSDESLRKAIFTRCCKNDCILKLSVNYKENDFNECFQIVREARSIMAKYDKIQRSNMLINMLKGN